MTYAELVEKARETYESEDTPHVVKAWLLANIIYPTDESEDERIRKELIEQVAFIPPNQDELKSDLDTLPCYNERIERYRSWLEKQGEKRPTENVEIKFCKGDKVVSNQDGKVYTVGTAYYVTGDNICLHDTDGNHKWTNKDDLNRNYHLWASEDAKKLNADEVIAWLVANICDYEYYVKQFKKDFEL